MKDKVMTCYT